MWLLGCGGEAFAGDKGAAEPGKDAPSVRSIAFSGLQWNVKASTPGNKLGPGPNDWGGTDENVWLDKQGRLHLKITKRQDEHGKLQWFCAEIVSLKSFGYGEYRWYLDTPIKADPKVVLGLFTWDDSPESEKFHHREIDIELISMWGDASGTNAQFVVQPWLTPGNRHRFAIADPGLSATTHSFLWRKNNVLFRSLRGQGSGVSGKNSLLEEWNFSGADVPPAGRKNGEKVRMNLWLISLPTNDSSEAEVVISKFEFVPLAKASVTTVKPER
jgi:hypothetical protein